MPCWCAFGFQAVAGDDIRHEFNCPELRAVIMASQAIAPPLVVFADRFELALSSAMSRANLQLRKLFAV